MTAASFILEEGSVGPFRFCWTLSRDRGLKRGLPKEVFKFASRVFSVRKQRRDKQLRHEEAMRFEKNLNMSCYINPDVSYIFEQII